MNARLIGVQPLGRAQAGCASRTDSLMEPRSLAVPYFQSISTRSASVTSNRARPLHRDPPILAKPSRLPTRRADRLVLCVEFPGPFQTRAIGPTA